MRQPRFWLGMCLFLSSLCLLLGAEPDGLTFGRRGSAALPVRRLLSGVEPGRVTFNAHLPPIGNVVGPTGRLAATTNLSLAMGLRLRNPAGLEELLAQLYDPRHANFHKFLTPLQFAANFGPTDRDYQAAIAFARTNGLSVVGTHASRLVLDLEGSVSNIERAFGTILRTYRHPAEDRDFFAPDAPPSVPAHLPVVDVEGLTDFKRPRPMSHPARPAAGKPLSGSGPNGYLAGNDFRNAYVPGCSLTGAGQAVALLEFTDYYKEDIANYENTIGLTNYVPVIKVVVGPTTPGTANNAEAALDIELAIAMAPGLSQVIVYEEKSINASSILSRMADDNLATQLSSSWSWGGGPSSTVDRIFQQMAAQGQSFFQASGDTDAYTGANAVDNPTAADAPVDSPYVTCVGGVTLTLSGSVTAWASETVWNFSSSGGSEANVGSGGGISSHYTIPTWQTNVSMLSNQGSTTWRCIPDVALTAADVYVAYNNGSSGGFAGTSCAAPLWAGFTALVNQQSLASGGASVGFLNPALYSIASGASYASCFHDTTTGNNIGVNTPGLFYATTGYDLCTGLGTPTGTNLINALAPNAALEPSITSQPASQSVLSGSNATFSVTASSPSAMAYQWRCNATNLVNGAAVSGAAGPTLTLTGVTPNNAGSYTVVISNGYGAVTSTVALLTVLFPPVLSTPLPYQSIECGNNASFAAAASGTPPLAYQWSLDGQPIAGATNSSLLLTNVYLPNHIVAVVVTNLYGSATNLAVLAVVDTTPPVITLLGGNPIYVELGSAFSDPGATATDVCSGALAVTVSGTVNTNVVGTNVLVYTASDGSGNTASLTRTVIVQDTAPPTIVWSFTNLVLAANPGSCSAQMPDVTGTNFIVATDLAGALTFAQTPTNGSTLYLGTNLVVISVADAYSNAAYSTNTITVADETAPAFVDQPQSQTNAAGASASFSVLASACTPIAYQWFFNGAALANQTNGTLTLPGITSAVAGSYWALATAAGGSATSAVVVLTLSLTAANTLPQIVGVAGKPDGSVTINLAGTPGYTYILEATANLESTIAWQPVATNVPGPDGLWQFTDNGVTTNLQRFYRLTLGP